MLMSVMTCRQCTMDALVERSAEVLNSDVSRRVPTTELIQRLLPVDRQPTRLQRTGVDIHIYLLPGEQV